MATTRSRLPLAVINLLAFIAVIVVNALSTTIPLGGMTPGQLSDLYPNLFVPAGLTFSIWGVIYLLLGAYVVYGLVIALKKSGPDFMEKIGALFIVSCAANAGWIFAWQYRVVPLSLVCMAVLLISLIMMYQRLRVGESDAGAAEKFLVHMPMSVYLGWISIATIANATALLVYYKWNGFGIGEQVWAVLMICIGILLGLIFLFLRKDVFYTLVIDWAVLGILLKRTATDGGATQAVVIASIAGLCLLTLGIIAQVIRRKVYK